MAVPDQLTPYVVRHRFRAKAGGWPCVQIGPGVASVNFVSDYTWKSFRETVLYFTPLLTAAYADSGHPLVATSVLLRYVNGVPFDSARTDIVEYIANHLNVRLAVPQEIGESATRDGVTEGIVVRIGLPLSRPAGVGYVQVGNGTRDEKPALIWDLSVSSVNAGAPRLNGGFPDWLDQAHEVLEDWFFALIKGPLEAEFGVAGE
jgi:uncharacterized protein (TIGR04255 family)